ncbi:MAG: NlpC/P60 family protein [Pseudomonadota bacterium]|nr:NlpC/P60 family protein [Pseudomonadota bacterium]
MTGAEIVRLAVGWLGTPYHHQASLKGVGCDCLGLVRGVYAEAYGHPASPPPAYSKDLAEATGQETLLEAARAHLVEVPDDEWSVPGDVLVFRLRPGAMAKHCGIRTGPRQMIHAMEGAPVCEVHLSLWWYRRVAAVFRFPPQPKD